MKEKRFIKLEEKTYIKRKRDSERIEKLKPVITEAHKTLSEALKILKNCRNKK